MEDIKWYSSWELALVTVWFPVNKVNPKLTLPESLRDIKLIVKIRRDEVNARLAAQAQASGRESKWTHGEERSVAHNGGQLGIRDQTIPFGEVFDALDSVGDGLWAHIAEEDKKGTKMEIRFGEIFPGTGGIVPPEALRAFIAEFRDRDASVRNCWINPQTKRNEETGEITSTGRNVANLVLATSTGTEQVKIKDEDLFIFVRDGLPRVGSNKFKAKDPNHKESSTGSQRRGNLPMDKRR